MRRTEVFESNLEQDGVNIDGAWARQEKKIIGIKSGNEVVSTNEIRDLHEVRGRVADNAQVARIVHGRGPHGTHPRVHQSD